MQMTEDGDRVNVTETCDGLVSIAFEIPQQVITTVA